MDHPNDSAALETGEMISRRPMALRRASVRIGAGRALVLFSAAYAAVAFLVWPADYLSLARMYWHDFVFYVPVLLMVAFILAGPLFEPKRPISFVVELVRANGATAALVIALFFLSIVAFTTCKTNIPDVVPYYADRSLADLDEILHGAAPWQLAHDLSADWIASAVALTYGKIWFFQWFGMVLVAAFSARNPLHLRYLWALALTTLFIGTAMAMLMASVGPIYYDDFLGGTRFGALVATLADLPANRHVLINSEYLLTNFRNGTTALGTGISAMPSMHVAIATVNAFYFSSINRWLGLLGWGFAAAILFGSVYTGWHYAVDGYVAMLVVALIWRRTAFLARPTTSANRLFKPALPAAA